MRSVVIVQETLPHYRLEFFENLRDRLSIERVRLDVVAGQPSTKAAMRGDQAMIPWAKYRRSKRFGKLVWQPVWRDIGEADLVVVEHANRLLVNYLLAGQRVFGRGTRLAFWGHGANLQANRRGPAEQFKTLSVRWPDWWFAYTSGSADRVIDSGFPASRVTIVQNSQSVMVTQQIGSIAREPFKCVFVGGLHRAKRLRFLLDIADEAYSLCPTFRLVVIGDGESREDVATCGKAHVEYKGPLFGLEKAKAIKSSSLLLMPGLVGLVVIDSFAAETPVVTENSELHSPEFEYLVDGWNSLVLASGPTPREYARGIVEALNCPTYLDQLRSGCRRSSLLYSLDAMVENFATGVLEALRL